MVALLLASSHAGLGMGALSGSTVLDQSQAHQAVGARAEPLEPIDHLPGN